jgi:hypothetical protein
MNEIKQRDDNPLSIAAGGSLIGKSAVVTAC